MLLVVVILTTLRTFALCDNSLTKFNLDDDNRQIKDFFRSHSSEIFQYEKHTLCSYFNVDEDLTRDLSNWLIRSNFCPSIVIEADEDYSQLVNLYGKSEVTFVPVETLERIDDVIMEAQDMELWNSRAEIYIIVCSRVNRSNIDEALKVIWKNEVLNFALIAHVDDDVELFTYNPFTETIKNFSPSNFSRCTVFEDKLTNLHGHQLRVSLFEDFPVIIKRNGEWIGKDLNLLKVLTTMINATFTIKESHNFFQEAHDDISANTVDVSLNGHFMNGEYNNSITSYPNGLNGLVLIVPIFNSDFYDQTILRIFDSTSWGLCVAALAMMVAIFRFNYPQDTPSGALLKVLCYFLGNPVESLRCTRLIKSNVVNFILMCLVFRSAFQSFLISSLVEPPGVHKFTSVAELTRSPIMIYVTTGMAGFVSQESPELVHKFKMISVPRRLPLIYDKAPKGAHVVTRRHALGLLANLKSLNKDHYYILDETLVPGLDCYAFRKNTPYLNKFNDMLMRERQYQLSTYSSLAFRKVKAVNGTDIESTFENTVDKGDSGGVVLTVMHFRLIFHLLMLGWAVSLCVFVIEIVIVRMFNK